MTVTFIYGGYCAIYVNGSLVLEDVSIDAADAVRAIAMGHPVTMVIERTINQLGEHWLSLGQTESSYFPDDLASIPEEFFER